jgi:hypothetical protein
MKKVFFSAIAMIAFVGNSMGNNEVKDTKFAIEETCEERAMTFMTYMDSNNEMDQVEAHDYYRSFLEACYAINNTDAPNPKLIIGLSQ